MKRNLSKAAMPESRTIHATQNPAPDGLEELRREHEELIEAIRGSERATAAEEWQATFDAIVDMVSVHDNEFRIIRANRAMAEFFGVGLEQVLGRKCFGFFHQGQGPFSECPHVRMMRTGVAVAEEVHYAPKDISLWVTVSPLRDHGGHIVGAVHVARDITKLKRMEREVHLSRNLESIGVLAGGIAHDFNNLLTTVFGNIELARLYLSPDHPAFHLLSAAGEASGQARSLTNRLLTFSTGGAPVMGRIDVEDVLRKAVSRISPQPNIVCRLEITEVIWPVEADQGQLLQVFQNLIMNAIEAMPGGGAVTVAVGNVAVGENDPSGLSPGRRVRITVRDEGEGIPKENVHRIFDPYFTTKGMGTRKGTGLGLSICHSIVRRHGGWIEVGSGPQRGAVFNVFLPAIEPISARKRAGADEAAVANRRRVLVMDDEEPVRKVASRMLILGGYEVETAVNGEEAIRKYETALKKGIPFDAVLIDLTIRGGMGGLETMEELVRIDPDVLAIVNSGYTDAPALSDFRRYGFAGAMAKPFLMRELNDLLSRILEKGPDAMRGEGAPVTGDTDARSEP